MSCKLNDCFFLFLLQRTHNILEEFTYLSCCCCFYRTKLEKRKKSHRKFIVHKNKTGYFFDIERYLLIHGVTLSHPEFSKARTETKVITYLNYIPTEGTGIGGAQ